MTNPTDDIQTERLILRQLREDDRADFIAAVNDFAVSKWLAVVPHPYSDADFDEWFVAFPNLPHTFVIALDDRAIGSIGFSVGDGITATGFGYWLARAHWGHGYMSEAAQAMIALAQSLFYNAIEANYFVGNAASKNVLTKLGFAPIGEGQATPKVTGVTVDTVEMRLTLA